MTYLQCVKCKNLTFKLVENPLKCQIDDMAHRCSLAGYDCTIYEKEKEV